MDDKGVLAGLVLLVFSLLFFVRPRRKLRASVAPVRPGDSLAEPSVQTVKVLHIVDGDTAIVANAWRKFPVRLDGIDCPEKDQRWGKTARAGLIKLIGGRRVRLESHGVDHYGRLTGTLYVRHRGKGWVNVNARMVTLGHAWVLRHRNSQLTPARQNELFRVEEWARSKRVGLWRESDPVPPWKWRNSSS